MEEGKIVTQNSSKQCNLCKTHIDDSSYLGEKYQLKDLVAHYYCVLLSYNIKQAGLDEEGILGFMYKDIFNAVQKVAKVKCIYCRRDGASIQCVTCRKMFHLPCSRMMGSLTIFDRNFDTYCQDHRPQQSIPSYVINDSESRNPDCIVCFDTINTSNTFNSFWMPCCQKNWCHRGCLVKLALSQAYLFKCPICSNKRKFKTAALKFGIFIPQRDASWELEPGAYDSLRVNAECDAVGCSCPRGRNHDEIGSRWEILFCVSCGSKARHIRCAKLKFHANEWECEECNEISVSLKSGKPRESNTRPERNITSSENQNDTESRAENESDSESSSNLPLLLDKTTLDNQSDVEVDSGSDAECSPDSPNRPSLSETEINVESSPRSSIPSHASVLKTTLHNDGYPVAGPSGISNNLACKSTGGRKKRCDKLINVTSDCSSDESSRGSCTSYAERMKKKLLADKGDISDTSMKCETFSKRAGLEKNRTRRRCARKSGKRCEKAKKIKSESESDLDVVTIEDSNSPKTICKKDKCLDDDEEITMIYQKEPVDNVVPTKCAVETSETLPPESEVLNPEKPPVFVTIDDKLHQIIQDDGETMVLKYHGNIINRTVIETPLVENQVQTLSNPQIPLCQLDNQNMGNDDIVQIWSNVTNNETGPVDIKLNPSGETNAQGRVPTNLLNYNDLNTTIQNVSGAAIVESNQYITRPFSGLTSTTQNIPENQQKEQNYASSFVEFNQTTQNVSGIQQDIFIYDNNAMGDQGSLLGETINSHNSDRLQRTNDYSRPITVPLSENFPESQQSRLNYNIPVECNQLNTVPLYEATSITENVPEREQRLNYNYKLIVESGALNSVPLSEQTLPIDNFQETSRRLNYSNVPLQRPNKLNVVKLSEPSSTAENVSERLNCDNESLLKQLNPVTLPMENSINKIVPTTLIYNNLRVVKSSLLKTSPLPTTVNIPEIQQKKEIIHKDLTNSQFRRPNDSLLSWLLKSSNPNYPSRVASSSEISFSQNSVVPKKILHCSVNIPANTKIINPAVCSLASSDSAISVSPVISQNHLNQTHNSSAYYSNSSNLIPTQTPLQFPLRSTNIQIQPSVSPSQLQHTVNGRDTIGSNTPTDKSVSIYTSINTTRPAISQNSAVPNKRLHSSTLPDLNTSAYTRNINPAFRNLRSCDSMISSSVGNPQDLLNQTYIPSANCANSSNLMPTQTPLLHFSSSQLQPIVNRVDAISSNKQTDNCVSISTTLSTSRPTMSASSGIGSMITPSLVNSQDLLNQAHIPSANYANSSNLIPTPTPLLNSSSSLLQPIVNRIDAISSKIQPNNCASNSTTLSTSRPTIPSSSGIGYDQSNVGSRLSSNQVRPEVDYFTTPLDFLKSTSNQSRVAGTVSYNTIDCVEQVQTSAGNVSNESPQTHPNYSESENYSKETCKNVDGLEKPLTIVISNVHSENPEFIANEKKAEVTRNVSGASNPNYTLRSLSSSFDAAPTKSTVSLPAESIRMCAVTGQVRQTSQPVKVISQVPLKGTNQCVDEDIDNSTRKRKKDELISEDKAKRKYDEDIIISDDDEVIDID